MILNFETQEAACKHLIASGFTKVAHGLYMSNDKTVAASFHLVRKSERVQVMYVESAR